MNSWNNPVLSATFLSTSMVRQQSRKLSFVIGIPVKSFPDDPVKMPAVQYAALIADLVLKTKQTLGALDSQRDGTAGFHYLRLRTKQDTELIITDWVN